MQTLVILICGSLLQNQLSGMGTNILYSSVCSKWCRCISTEYKYPIICCFTLLFMTVDVCMNSPFCSTCVLSVFVLMIESIIVNQFPAWSMCANKLSTIRLPAKDAVWTSLYSTSYIQESRIGFSVVTPIGLTFASFNFFLNFCEWSIYSSV